MKLVVLTQISIKLVRFSLLFEIHKRFTHFRTACIVEETIFIAVKIYLHYGIIFFFKKVIPPFLNVLLNNNFFSM